ncbi:Na(+)/dicarboxylate symporter [Mannheimia haemolytica]|uniref:Na(+)/dicarboxylate symporter n=1 Tax=Mannheimia haemolytica TaxID=75985 RepID=A0A448TDG0_MANHA|nr:SLC13 family permease [Mannheimia haemolytica]VEI78047.1 Na(+)/dicarboxylate symporter [Mannheimia haemolytica]HDV7284055.1 anion permease [Mannheimia haemolytica]
MSWDIVATLAVTGIAVFLFATEKMRMDAVAILVLCSLVLLGQVDTKSALSGFSNSATVTVTAMFVLAAGLQNSGALDSVGSLLAKVKSPWLFLLVLCGVNAAVSPFVNNTAVVAVLIPIVIAAAQNIKMAPSKALIPLSFSSQMAGVCTLIGTSTNLLVNAIAQKQGHSGFGMFEFAPLGIIFLVVGVAYLLVTSRFLLPESHLQLEDGEGFGKYVSELKVNKDSVLIGKSTFESGLNEEFNLFTIGVLRDGERLSTPSHQVLQKHDILLLRGESENLAKVREKYGLHHVVYGRRENDEDNLDEDLMVAEVMISPISRWIGGTIPILQQRWNKNATVLGIQRQSKVIRERLRTTAFKMGDILLLTLPKEDMDTLRQDKDFIVLSSDLVKTEESWKSKFALGVMVSVVATAALGWISISVSALIGAVAMCVAGCLTAEEAYQSIDWKIILVLAGLLPLGEAMANSGAAQFIVDNTLGKVGEFGPLVVLAVLYLLTMVLTEFMSNAGTAVLLTPIAVSTAKMLEVDASPFIIAVMFAAATSFMTPVGYQTNTMVYGAGGYKFTDFIKIGLPLNVIYWILGIVLIPIFFPFNP